MVAAKGPVSPATVIRDTLGVDTVVDGYGRIGVVSDSKIEISGGLPVRVRGSESPSATKVAGIRADGTIDFGRMEPVHVGDSGRRRSIADTYVTVSGQTVIADGVDSSRVHQSKGSQIGNFQIRGNFAYFSSARALLGRKQDDVAAYAQAAKDYHNTKSPLDARKAVAAAEKGGFVHEIPLELRMVSPSHDIATAMRQLRANPSNATNDMRVYEDAVRTLATLEQDPDRPIVVGGKTIVASRNEANQEMQRLLLGSGMSPQDVLAFSQRVARATGSDVPLIAELQEEAGGKTVAAE